MEVLLEWNLRERTPPPERFLREDGGSGTRNPKSRIRACHCRLVAQTRHSGSGTFPQQWLRKWWFEKETLGYLGGKNIISARSSGQRPNCRPLGNLQKFCIWAFLWKYQTVSNFRFPFFLFCFLFFWHRIHIQSQDREQIFGVFL